MSDFRAIGGVSLTLQALLADRMEFPDGIASVPITIGPPPFSSKDNDPHQEAARVNLFLYRVTENANLQNQEIPGRDSRGAYGHPPLSLNLHYLVTAYGNSSVNVETATMYDETVAQFLLGSAMRALHDVPIVNNTLTTARAPSGNQILHDSLRDDYEHVKLSLEPLSLEDVTKVWTSLALRFRLSAAYAVNVVQIESRRRRSFPKPVGMPVSPVQPPLPADPPGPGPMVFTLTIQTPTITDIKVIRALETTEQPVAYARIGDTLVLRGTSLAGPVTAVAFGDVTVPATFVSPLRVEAVVPDATISGQGPIPPELQLQPGAQTVRVVIRDPRVPQRVFTSNELAFMLVPMVNKTLSYAPGPRRLTIDGTRLIATRPSGETVIGRVPVPRLAYLAATLTQIVVPIPDELPTSGVQVVVGNALPDPISIGAGPQEISVTIGVTTKTITANLPSNVPRSSIALALAGLIHDAAPDDPRFYGTRVDLWGTRLVIVPGGLTDSLVVASSGGSTLADKLGLTAPMPAGANNAYLSGLLDSPPPLSAANPRLGIQIGAAAPMIISVAPATSLAAMAGALQANLNAASQPEYANALVGVSASQLLVIPGTANPVIFTALPADATTVAELQLHARFAVRVRVNGAESVDDATVELPQ